MDDEAEKGTTYFYAVRAENGHGMGSMTDHVSIKLELEREKGKMDLTLWIIAAVVLLLIVIAVSISILLWSNRSVPFIEEE